jgi:predicted lipoprotein with Yx(FWY)xxD motif
MKITLIGLALAGAVATGAQAHIVLDPQAAAPDTRQVLRFVVGHGCNGQPTTTLRIEPPSGLSMAAAHDKPGWTLQVEKAHGRVTAVTWRGALPPGQRDAFELEVRTPAKVGPVAIPVIQTCGEEVVRWAEPIPADGPKPPHPAPVLTVGAPAAAAPAPAPVDRLPAGIQRLADGGLADQAGKPLYIFDNDVMVGMSHCVGQCARTWPPLIAPREAKPFGPWTLVIREDGARQWALKDKPLYVFADDTPGQPPKGEAAANWKRAK